MLKAEGYRSIYVKSVCAFRNHSLTHTLFLHLLLPKHDTISNSSICNVDNENVSLALIDSI